MSRLPFAESRLAGSHQASERAGLTRRIIDYRRRLAASCPQGLQYKTAEEGGCGVVGFAASVPVSGRHIFEPSIQMHNRGNGKGGGIAAAGLIPEQLGVDQATLRDDYLLQVALLDPSAENEVENTCISPFLDIHHKAALKPDVDYRELGLEVKPPDVLRYFVRVKEKILDEFADTIGREGSTPRQIEDEFIYHNSRRLNAQFYTSLGEKRAFVLSHARDLLILKVVGYAETVVKYYSMENFKAKVWIAHQRYPTKGRVWHPGGSHPFIGLNEALVHNGDFANYHSVSEYLVQHGITTQFLTDTEVAVLLFDLWNRTYRYPLEYVIEAMAPTTEWDFDQLPEEKRHIYRALQAQHMHGSPDGPWFFIIARSNPDQGVCQLLGITDTSMLRPQVFALQEGDVSIGLVASEKQAIDATLSSLAEEDPRFRKVADRYWNARGGSSTDGGAFVFTVTENGGPPEMSCQDKFGRVIASPPGEYRLDPEAAVEKPAQPANLAESLSRPLSSAETRELFGTIAPVFKTWNFGHLNWLLGQVEQIAANSDEGMTRGLELLALMNDRRYETGNKKRGLVLQLIQDTVNRILDRVPGLDAQGEGRYRRIDWSTRETLRAPQASEEVLVVSAQGFQPEGEDCDSRLETKAYQLGWRKFMVYRLKGQRFQGCGLGPATEDVRFDLFGSSGDYIASGIDGMEIHIHGNGQDQLSQIMKEGTLVVHGDVGQAFMYGAKGGSVFVMGNAAGRPLINAVGRPRVVINGTCLDFLAESFMAGDPLNGGGFVILNGMEFDDQGKLRPQPTPYPGGNLFSLASGGAIFIRDPQKKIVDQQLNGGKVMDLTQEDWQLILPFLQTNEQLFGISIEDDLLMVNGTRRPPLEVYRKVMPMKTAVLAKNIVPE